MNCSNTIPKVPVHICLVHQITTVKITVVYSLMLTTSIFKNKTLINTN